jgi:threonine aldolase
MLGGGMRQAGIAAAAGLYALDNMINRLAEDHANARRLALLLADVGLPIDPADVESNMVFLDVPEDLMNAEAFVAELGALDIVINPPKGRRVRFVTHHDIGAEDVTEAGRRIASLVRARRQGDVPDAAAGTRATPRVKPT